jgi:hypothetical protein
VKVKVPVLVAGVKLKVPAVLEKAYAVELTGMDVGVVLF